MIMIIGNYGKLMLWFRSRGTGIQNGVGIESSKDEGGEGSLGDTMVGGIARKNK